MDHSAHNQSLSDLSGSGSVVYFSRFSDRKPGGGGGIRRTRQIFEFLDGIGYRFLSAVDMNFIGEELDAKRTRLIRFQHRMISRFMPKKWNHWRGPIANYVKFLDQMALVFIKILIKQRYKLIIVDEPIFFRRLVKAASSLGIPVIGLIHNIESMVPAQVWPHSQMKLFQQEIEILKKTAACVTISHEDTAVLTNFGIPAVLLPYYPVKEYREQCLEIRKRRVNTTQEKTTFLFVGTAANPPTRASLVELIRFWEEDEILSKGYTLLVAGHGTEAVKEFVGDSLQSVKILGTLSDEELSERLSVCRAVVIYQKDGSGALTRIPELLLSGVPVIANCHAARTYHNIPGITEYEELSDLPDALSALSDGHPSYEHVPDYAAIRKRITDRIGN